jgi:UDP-N-acetylmuramoyl-L-alanyl-D-glutamate--2,6-diaminopimelate ligase
MKLSSLLRGIKIKELKGDADVEIKSLCQSTNKIEKGCLFFCYSGVNFDGHDYIADIESQGAVAVVVERFVDTKLPQILVNDTRKVMPKICNKFFGNVLKKLTLIGVTGTNGKTTTASLIFQILCNDFKNAGFIGTGRVEFGGKVYKQNMTTPDTVDLFQLFHQMSTSGVKFVVMEVTAHALDLNKLYGIKFEVGVFSNLSQDHLDYFKNMGTYALCKLKFLKKRFCKFCVINTDDKYGEMFAKLSDSLVTTYGIKNPARNFAIDLQLNVTSTHYVANVFDHIFDITTNLLCKFNVYNELSAIVCAKILEIDDDVIVKTIQNVKRIDGRMNFCKLNNGAVAVVDFAHTPEALESVLSSLKSLVEKRVICVFGCGGDRDKLKRSKMGRVATVYADYVFVTSDNPRSEDPQKIIDDITDGICTSNFEIDENRTRAIVKAINFSSRGDVILIAGKGAEDYQEIKGVKYNYSDFDVLKDYILD